VCQSNSCKIGSAVRSVSNMRGQSCNVYQCQALCIRDRSLTACRKGVLFRHQILCKAEVSSRAEHLQAKVLSVDTSPQSYARFGRLPVRCNLCINEISRALFARYRPKAMATTSLWRLSHRKGKYHAPTRPSFRHEGRDCCPVSRRPDTCQNREKVFASLMMLYFSTHLNIGMLYLVPGSAARRTRTGSGTARMPCGRGR
jgi:hypothetical protein